MEDRIKGLTALVLTSLIWGSSFIFIKLSVSSIDGLAYTFYRAVLALAILAPVGLAYRRRFSPRSLKKSFIVGLSYIIGLALQGLGTEFTTPSISAFVTGLNTVFVYIYEFFKGSGSWTRLSASLVLSTVGLYLLTKPSGELTLGVLLVLAGAVAWAVEIILVSVWNRELSADTLSFLVGLLLPGLLLAPYILIADRTIPSATTLLFILYLSLFCTIVASILQVLGQKYVPAYAAATIYLLEPVSAMIFSVAFYGERPAPEQVAGSLLILIAIYVASK
ncbi:MAG: DMT family transporter [Thermogladius sp.]|nr:DMT family transporter [Thermogladius sp.]